MSDDRSFVASRLFPVERGRVFAAFTDPALLAKWFGPNGFSNTFHAFDPRPGGDWHLTMHGPDGTDYANEWRFVEVSPGRIVIDHLRPMHWFRLTVTLAAEGDGTRLTWHQQFETAAEADRVRPYVPAANEQNLDKLAAELNG